MNRISIFIISVIVMFFGGSAWAQHLTISNSGETGTSGTNWSISGNILQLAASGSASVHPSVIENHLTNTGDLTISIPKIIGTTRSIIIANSISYTGNTNRTLTFNAPNHFYISSGANITSSNAALNLVFRAVCLPGSPDNGIVQIVNSSINTNGGHLWIAGGPSDATWNGLTVGNHYARTWTDDVKGLEIIGSNINTNGGHLYIAGYSWNSANTSGNNFGIDIDFTSINTAAGNIEIDGYLNGLYFTGSGTRIDARTGPISINTTSGNILIKGFGGDATGSTGVGWRHSLLLYSTNNNPPHTLTIKSVSGNITLNGAAAFNGSTVNDAEGITFGSTNTSGVNVVSQTGSIEINGSNTRANTGQFCNGIRFFTGDITNAIVIGDDGIHPYSGNITINADAILQRYNSTLTGNISVKTAGILTVQPQSNSFTYLRAGNSPGILTFDNDWNFGTSNSIINIGKDGNSFALTLSNALTTSGSIKLYAGNLTINAPLSGAALLAKATGNISLSANVTTNNGDIILWSDSDNNNAGSITLADNITVNSANGSTASNLSGGGNIVFAGGADNGANSGTANDNIPDNYAQSSTGLGLSLGTTEANLTQCYSGGGNIILNGKSTLTGGDAMARIGVMQNGKLIANAGNGSILMNGSSSGFYAINFVFLNGATLNDPTYLTLISNKSTGNAIQISGTSVNNYGIVFNYNSPKQVLATGGGNIQMTGVAGANNGIFLQNVNLLATSGDINLDGGTLGIKIPSGGARFGAVSGTSITSSSSNIKFIGNAISIDDPNPVFSSTGFSTSGTITIEPKTTSFSSAFTWPSYLTTTSATSGLTIGKLNNTVDITINAAQNINGPITIYGGALSGSGVLSLASGNNLSLYLSSNSTYANAINGTNVNLIKAGAGALTLSAACGYTGSTTVNAGTLQFNENKAFNATTIANGATLALGPNKQFDLNSTLANNGTLNLKSGATILHGGSNTISGTGSYVVEQAITGTNSGGTPNGRFWYLGSPVTSVSSSVFFGNAANVLKKRNETNNTWVAITNATPENLEVGKGYYTQATTSSTISFSGSALNNGAISISGLTRTTGQGFEGFNLVANPYPSYLDWDAVTKTDVGNTMWYRTFNSTNNTMVFDTYVAGTGGIGTNLNGAGVSNLIPPMQSFWVRVNSGSTTGSLALSNSMRAHFTSINGSTAGLKSTSNERDLFLRMNLMQADKKDQLIVYVNETATNGFDVLDGEKMMQAGMPQFYTSAAGKKITINGLNSAKKQQALPITMELPTTGVHSFVIEELEIDNGLVWLEDKQEEIMQALEPGTVYEFYANSGINAERFVLHFQLIDNTTPINVYNEVNGSANFSGKGASVHAESAGVVVIKLPATTEGVTDIQIRDAAGRLVYTGATNTLETSVQLAQANGIYYVTLNSAAGVEVRKVFVQQ